MPYQTILDFKNTIKHREYILDFYKFRIVILVLLSFSVSACITLPGHRQTIDEGDFYLHITTPNKATKSLIRFNAEKTDIAYLPANSEMELAWNRAAGVVCITGSENNQ